MWKLLYFREQNRFIAQNLLCGCFAAPGMVFSSKGDQKHRSGSDYLGPRQCFFPSASLLGTAVHEVWAEQDVSLKRVQEGQSLVEFLLSPADPAAFLHGPPVLGLVLWVEVLCLLQMRTDWELPQGKSYQLSVLDDRLFLEFLRGTLCEEFLNVRVVQQFVPQQLLPLAAVVWSFILKFSFFWDKIWRVLSSDQAIMWNHNMSRKGIFFPFQFLPFYF